MIGATDVVTSHPPFTTSSLPAVQSDSLRTDYIKVMGTHAYLLTFQYAISHVGQGKQCVLIMDMQR